MFFFKSFTGKCKRWKYVVQAEYAIMHFHSFNIFMTTAVFILIHAPVAPFTNMD